MLALLVRYLRGTVLLVIVAIHADFHPARGVGPNLSVATCMVVAILHLCLQNHTRHQIVLALGSPSLLVCHQNYFLAGCGRMVFARLGVLVGSGR